MCSCFFLCFSATWFWSPPYAILDRMLSTRVLSSCARLSLLWSFPSMSSIDFISRNRNSMNSIVLKDVLVRFVSTMIARNLRKGRHARRGRHGPREFGMRFLWQPCAWGSYNTSLCPDTFLYLGKLTDYPWFRCRGTSQFAHLEIKHILVDLQFRGFRYVFGYFRNYIILFWF